MREAVPGVERLVRAVSALYGPAVASCRWDYLGNAGGFSGARLWRGVPERPASLLSWFRGAGAGAERPAWCLKGWPSRPADALPLARVHELMRLARGEGGAALVFVPAVKAALNGSTAVSHSGRWWDVTEWRPGQADYHAKPSLARLRAACVALARVHERWANPAEPATLCPAVERRAAALGRFASKPPPLPAGLPTAVVDLLRHAVGLARDRLGPAAVRLRPWLSVHVPLQPCLRDVWHDNVLFTGDEVTGLVDYGAAGTDHVAADLSRLLGSLSGGAADWSAGFAAYAEVRPFSETDAELARVLDAAGVVGAALSWCERLAAPGAAADEAGVLRRLRWLVARMEATGP